MTAIIQFAVSMFCTSGTFSKILVGSIAPFLPGVLQISCFLTIFLSLFFILKSQKPNKLNSKNYKDPDPTKKKIDSNTAAKWAAIIGFPVYYVIMCLTFIMLLFIVCKSPINKYGDSGELVWTAKSFMNNPNSFIQSMQTQN